MYQKIDYHAISNYATSFHHNAVYGEYYYRPGVTHVWKRLKYQPHAQAGVIAHEDGGVSLISYATLVCTIDGEGWLTCTGTYSATTRRHIGSFLKEFAPGTTYYDAKFCYENDCSMNVNTGEVIDLKEKVTI